MASLASFAQFENRPPCQHFTAMRQKTLEHLAQIQQARLAVDQGDHVHAERVLQLGRLVQIIKHNLGDFAALELNDDTHPGLIGFVPDVADPLDFLLVDQFRHALQQGALVDLIRQLVDDDRLTSRGTSALNVFKVSSGAHDHPPAPRAIALANARESVNNSGCWEIRGWDLLDQFVNGDVRAFQQQQATVKNLVEIMWRHIGRHADRDSGASVDQKVRNPCRQDQRLALATVIVGTKVHSLAINIGKQFVRDTTEADLGVSHRGGVIAIDRAEIALTVDQ